MTPELLPGCGSPRACPAAVAGLVLLALLMVTAARPVISAERAQIYVCTDAQGRRISSDRPIPGCLDLPQRRLSNTGVTTQVLPPTPTAVQQQEEQDRQRQAERERQQAREHQRRDRALLIRYPTVQSHELARQAELERPREVIDAAHERLEELLVERSLLNEELEFYPDLDDIPARLKNAIAVNEASMITQNRVIAAQEHERARINARFDEEAVYLEDLRAKAVDEVAR